MVILGMATGTTGATGAAAPDFNTLVTSARFLLTTTADTFQQYSDLKAQRQPLLDQRVVLQEKERDREQILGELNRMEETYDTEFLERKASPAVNPAMRILGLNTTQDKAVAFFYFAYVLFSVAVILYFLRVSTQKIRAFLFSFTIMAAVLSVVTVGIAYYG